MTSHVIFAGVMGKWMSAPLRERVKSWRVNAAEDGRAVGIRARKRPGKGGAVQPAGRCRGRVIIPN